MTTADLPLHVSFRREQADCRHEIQAERGGRFAGSSSIRDAMEWAIQSQDPSLAAYCAMLVAGCDESEAQVFLADACTYLDTWMGAAKDRGDVDLALAVERVIAGNPSDLLDLIESMDPPEATPE